MKISFVFTAFLSESRVTVIRPGGDSVDDMIPRAQSQCRKSVGSGWLSSAPTGSDAVAMHPCYIIRVPSCHRVIITVTFVDTDARAGVSAIGARSDRAGVSVIGARSLAGDWRSDILFLSERLSETLFILRTSGPLQRLSSAARLRKATEESQNILR